MNVSEVRKRYLDFFKARGHAVIPSAPVVPENDPTTLFTSSGMQPLVPYLMGQAHPEGTRLVDSQMSFRADDIEEVGDNRHTTFFEMLGNWSLGDYFKAEQLPWFFEFLTDGKSGLGLDPKNLYVTVFSGDKEAGMPADDESVGIWKELFAKEGINAAFVALDTEERGGELGMQGGRIFAYGAKKNWWSRAGTPSKMPSGEIGGPDSEVFYDFGVPHDPRFGRECHPNCDCGRFIEIGNSVFMQFIKKSDDSFGELPKRNVDFGGGLERLAAATHGDPDVFLIDVFDAARNVITERSGTGYGTDAATTRSFRIVLDHMRAASFMLASGITPANSEQGYVLRRLIRRSIREADKLGIKDTVLPEVAEGYGDAYADQYPFVKANHDFIRDELAKEEAQFRKTLANGMRELERQLEKYKQILGSYAFVLFTTYGFPLELTREIAEEHGITMSDQELDLYEGLMKKHREESRAGAAQKFAGGLADHQAETIRYHTAHHILLKALQMVLGPEVHQRGSNITSERLRIDFNYGTKLTDEQKREVERIVNEKIGEALPVTRTVMRKEDAEKLGAEHEFGATYPEQVSVYSVGPKDASDADPKFADAFSIEFCGGPHVANTAELGEGGKRFKIQKEEASSAGVRRIKAVLAAP
ncbi:alanine--tRNA ligase [Patescibacteria group bacterium]|nr:alanine--tRNA ligase [Patescibacteria group bacterium]